MADVVCEVCGAVGFKHLLVQCNECKNSTRHRYCLDTIIYDGTLIEWFCGGCLHKHNKVAKSIEDHSNKKELSHPHLDSSAMVAGEKFKHYDVEKEGEIENQNIINASGSADPTSEPSVSFQEWLNLSNENDSCSFQSNYVEGSIRQEIKDDLFPSTNDNERSHPFVTNDSCPALPDAEQADDSSRAIECEEQPYPSAVNNNPILGSKSPSCYSHPMEGSDPSTRGVDGLDPSKECLESRSLSKTTSFSKGQGRYSSDENYSAKTTQHLTGKYIVGVALACLTGSSSRMVEEFSVSNVDKSNEANSTDKCLLSTTDRTERDILSRKVHCTHEVGSSSKGNESSNPKPVLNGSRHGRNRQNDEQATSVCAGGDVACGRVSPMEGSNNVALPSKSASSCKTTKSSSKNRNSRLEQLDHTSLELSSKTKQVHDANDAEHHILLCNEDEDAQSFENAMPKKRRQHILSCNNDEDVEAMQVEDSNPLSCENDVLLNKHMVESGVINQRKPAENLEEVPHPKNSSHEHVNNSVQAKKQRIIEANDDENAPLRRDPNVGCTQNDTTQLALQAVVTEDYCRLFRMPVISAPTDQQSYTCTQPIDIPYWTGMMKVGQENISLAAEEEIEQQDKMRSDTPDMPSETERSDQEKAHSNAEAPRTHLFGLINPQTPRSVQLLRELVNEGVQVFAV